MAEDGRTVSETVEMAAQDETARCERAAWSIGVPETVDEEAACVIGMAETVDEEAACANGTAETVDKPQGKSRADGKRERKKPDDLGDKAYYGKLWMDLIPYLTAALVLLAVTQLTAAVLWSGQQKRQAELYRIYGAEYVQK